MKRNLFTMQLCKLAAIVIAIRKVCSIQKRQRDDEA